MSSEPTNTSGSIEDDRSLVESYLSRRDETSFRLLYWEHTPSLFRIAFRTVGNHAAAEDVVQETWARAVARLDQFEWRSTLRTWLTSILLNCCREFRRRVLRVTELSDGPNDSGAHRVHYLRIDLEREVWRLPDGYRAAIILHDIEGFTHQEVAEIQGIEPGTSKSQLFHARRVLRDRMKERSGERS